MDPTLLPASASGHEVGVFVWHDCALPDSLLGTMPQQSIPLRVLIIDDDPTIREVLAVLLQGEGYAVDSVDSGEAALILVNRPQSAFDLVLADVQMPGMTAAEFAPQLRLACSKTTLLLAISGSQPSAKITSLFDGFLLKPFKIKDVIAALRMQKDAAPDAENLPALERDIEAQEPPCVQSIGESPAPVLNESIYRQLASSIPAPQLEEMYTLCVNDARKRIAAMRTLLAARDCEQFVREAHSIKGGCGMLGATELHRRAAELEINGLQSSSLGALEDVNSLDDLSAACDRLERMLKSRV